MIFTGESRFLSNQAKSGGAVLAIESILVIYGETIISSNIATNSSGGGISLIHSNLDIHLNCIISGNHAAKGGGIHASS